MIGYKEELNLYMYATIYYFQRKTILNEIWLTMLMNFFYNFHQNLQFKKKKKNYVMLNFFFKIKYNL